MEPEYSLLHSQEPTTSHCPEPDDFISNLPTLFTKIHLATVHIVIVISIDSCYLISICTVSRPTLAFSFIVHFYCRNVWTGV